MFVLQILVGLSKTALTVSRMTHCILRAILIKHCTSSSASPLECLPQSVDDICRAVKRLHTSTSETSSSEDVSPAVRVLR